MLNFYIPIWIRVSLVLFVISQRKSLGHSLITHTSDQRLHVDSSSIPHESYSASCYSGTHAISCSPSFENLARNARIDVNSICGIRKSQRLCNQDGNCKTCNQKARKSHFSQKFLIDSHFAANRSCWASSLARPGGLDRAVNITFSLGKRFEVSHVSFTPCLAFGRIPDSIAIFKSSDFARTWKPWHFISNDCYRAFGLPTTDEHNTQITGSNLQEVLCVALRNQQHFYKERLRRRSMGLSGNYSYRGTPYNFDYTITFSTTLGRPMMKPWSPALVDWMTMTDLRISLMKFATNEEPNSLVYPKYSQSIKTGSDNSQTVNHSMLLLKWNGNPWFRARLPRSEASEALKLPNLPKLDFSSDPQHLTDNAIKFERENEDEPDVLTGDEYFAISDIIVGGWCKCNGHAEQCLLGLDGQLECACKHNTEGRDCERCKSGFMDRPWERATMSSANACTRCDCNLHSNECRFSNALYLVSNRISGGVCENCRHNTAGRHCQHCSEGFYRDWTKPPNHEQACLPCRCHPIGSVIKNDCDRRSGQCRCKQGVTGLTCDRCQDGYHQTRSPRNPCTNDFSEHRLALAHTPAGYQCHPCEANKERMKLKKFCKRDAVIQASFRSRELHGMVARFDMFVEQIWKIDHTIIRNPQGPFGPLAFNVKSHSTNHIEDNGFTFPTSEIPVWIHLNNLRCKCPEIELGISYLVVTDIATFTHNGRLELLLTRKAAVLPWRKSWRRRLARLRRRQIRGVCERFQEMNKLNVSVATASTSTTNTLKRNSIKSSILSAAFRQEEFPRQHYYPYVT